MFRLGAIFCFQCLFRLVLELALGWLFSVLGTVFIFFRLAQFQYFFRAVYFVGWPRLFSISTRIFGPVFGLFRRYFNNFQLGCNISFISFSTILNSANRLSTGVWLHLAQALFVLLSA
jgi:hypothetical protein